MKRYLWCLFVILVLSACSFKYGFIESNFHLSPNSRLPKFVSLPEGYSRSNVDVEIYCYMSVLGKKNIQFFIYTLNPEHKLIMKVAGTYRWHPLTEQEFKEHPKTVIYPNYTIVTVNGIEEVFENKGEEAILYVTDDPKYTAEIR